MTGILNTTSLSRAAAAALSALLLSGCAALSGGGSEAIPADAMKRPVDLSVVCVLVNEDVKSEPLVKSLETGVRSFGSVPALEASGRANPGSGLTVDNVAAYMVQLLNQTKKRLGDRAVLPAAPEPVPTQAPAARQP